MLSGLETGRPFDQDGDESTTPIPIIDPETSPLPIVSTLQDFPAAVADRAGEAEPIDRHGRQAAVLAAFAGLVVLADLALATGLL